MEAQPAEGGAKRRRLRLLALGLSALIGCLVAEVALRVAAPQPTFARLAPGSPRCYRASDVAPRELQPNARTRLVRPEFEHPIRINGQGLRMDREVGPPAAGTPRVLVIGDSFTFGHGVAAAEAYPQQLEGRLDGVEVLNLGFAYGYSPDGYYAGLRKYGERFGGEVLIVGLFVGNDLTAGIENRWAEVDAAGLPTRVEARFTTVDGEHRSRPIDTLFRYRVPVLRSSHLFIGLARLLGSGAEPLAAKYRAALQAMHTPALYEPGWSTELSGLVDRQVKCLRGLADLAKQRKQRFLVALIPHARQVYHLAVDGEGAARTLKRTLRAEVGLGLPQRRVREQLAGVAVLDLLPAFVGARDLSLYYELDGHWTGKGHAKAAGWIAAELRRLEWVP